MMLFEEANSILQELFNNLVVLFTSINWDVIFFAGLAFEILFAVFFLIKSRFSYEMRVIKKLLKLNNWLNKNRYIDPNNLIEFNNMMKKTPKHLRYYWHEYMLNREKEPSYYMSTYNLVEKPLKSSSFLSNIKNFKISTILMVSFIVFFSILKLNTVTPTFGDFALCVLTPLVMFLFYGIISIIMRASQNMSINSLYQYVHYYGRFLDRAVTTMPDYVDFEVLFTRREIKKGIPVLNEYLEKRARQEQEELEKARINAVEHETYDFSSTGINGALVLDRAINESETYINIRARLLSEIQQLEGEIDSIKRTYENTEKDFQKKMQVSKENVDRLRQQQEETTNRIESNYIKKQQADEIKKQEQLEKDNDAATARFNQEMSALTTEIVTRRKELEERRKHVEDAMKAEYQSFSTKLYKSLTTILQEESQDEKAEILEIKDEIAIQLQQAHENVAQKDREIAELKRLLQNNNIDFNAYVGYSSEKLKRESKKRKDKKSKAKTEQEAPQTQAQIMASLAPTSNFANDPNLIPLSQIKEEDRQYGEDGGFYDENGYYRYTNGTYFTPNSEFHDEFGGWYEADAITYHAPDQQLVDSIVNAPPQNLKGLKRMAEIPESERQYSEEGGFFDKDGYYFYANGTYFTPDGRFFDEFGGWFEPDGVTYHKPEEGDQDGQSFEPISNNEPLANIQDEDIEIQKPLSAEVKKEITKLQDQFNIKVDKNKPSQVIEEIEQPEPEPAPAPAPEIVVEEPQVLEEPQPAIVKEEKPQPQEELPEIKGGVKDKVEPNEALFEAGEEKPVQTPKKKAGRPRTKVAPNDEDVQKEKRPRGRPKKVLSVNDVLKAADGEKRGRGRPKKTLSADQVESLQEILPEDSKPETNTKHKRIDNTEDAENLGNLMTAVDYPDMAEIDKLDEEIASESNRLAEHEEEFNNQINETLFQLSNDDEDPDNK